MPQSSRTIVTFWAWRCQRARSPRRWAGAEAARQSALLTSSSIDRNGGSRGKNEVNGVSRVYQHRIAGEQIQVGPGRHPGGDRGVEARGLVVDCHEAFVAARKREGVRAVVPPVVHVGARDDVTEAHHFQNRRIAVLADPLALTGGLEARRTGDGRRPAIRVRGWAQRVL